MDIFSAASLTALLQVIAIDLVLAGDNAIVIGLAAAGLPTEQRKRAILIGVLAATVLRILFAAVTVKLLAIVGLLLAAFCVAAGLIGHYGQGGDDAMLAFLHQQMLMKDIAIAGGFLALAMAGAGAWSIDGRSFGVGADIT
ncbi:MAG: hypothetical protein E5V46_23810 [Mesorhizobium sp.]|nr:MAG: hypothetical protein E5V46_23810 [Mesorhizobium sp.]